MADESYPLPIFQGSDAGASSCRSSPASKPFAAATLPPRRSKITLALSAGRILLLAIACLTAGGCDELPPESGPTVEIIRVPLTDAGGTPELDLIEGRVTGAQPGQRIVLFARSGAWYVQPFTEQPFTDVQPDSRWMNSTHLGTEYAALLVEPDYRPPTMTYALPGRGEGVVAVVVVEGLPRFWQTWWFRLLIGLAAGVALLALYRFRMHRLTRRLNLRFEERLAERMLIAQELHDTLLQGFISASMQLHVVVEELPADSPAKTPLGRVQHLMGQVIEEGRNAVRGLRSPGSDSPDLEHAFSRIRQEIAVQEPVGFRVVIGGRPRPLHPMIRDEVYRIGREALVNAFRHARAQTIEVEVEYVAHHLRVVVRDDGLGIDAQVLRSGRDGHWGLSGMRERAERIGARLKVRSRAASGTEVELSVPSPVAYQTELSDPGSRRFSRWLPRRRRLDPHEPGSKGVE